MKKSIHIIPALLLMLPSLAFAQYAKQKYSDRKTIQWETPKKETLADGLERRVLSFNGAMYDEAANYLPVYTYRLITEVNASQIRAFIVNPTYGPFESGELDKIQGLDKIPQEIQVNAAIGYDRRQKVSVVSFIPIRKNSAGQYEKLVSFEIQVVATEFKSLQQPKSATAGASSSVLASGNWYKVSVTEDGIYKLTYEQLNDMGMNVDDINAQDLRVYGNGGGMLPKSNAAYRRDDLQENAITVVGGGDGSFDAGDYILFYGQGPHRWTYNTTTSNFEHTLNDYSDATYYFVTADLGPGKRVAPVASSGAAPTHNVTTFNDYAFHESDQRNLIKSGRQWYGELFDIQTAYDFSFSFPNIDGSTPAHIKVAGAAQCICGSGLSTSSFSVKINGNSPALLTIPFLNVTGNYDAAQAYPGADEGDFTTSSSSINVTINYNKGNSSGSPSATGWLNYIEVNARRALSMAGGQTIFRDMNSVGAGNIAEFTLANAGSVTIWDVTDPVNAMQQQASASGSSLVFRAAADTLHEYVAFNGSSFLTPASAGQVANQNIHGMPQSDMVIVVHPDYLSEAQRLADFHRNNVVDPLTVLVVLTTEVYNEFSSGAQDVSAIRDMMKMFYDRSTGPDDLPKYLLLFGDGSYDNRDRMDNNTNRIVTYQSIQSTSPTSSYVSDDFFGFMDSNEGIWVEGCDTCNPHFLDIAVGRLPVQNITEATTVVNKILAYETIPGVQAQAQAVCTAQTVNVSSPDWKNWICFIADDQDNNDHLNQSDGLASQLDTTQNDYNIDKIYFDAFIQESTPGGQRYPTVKDAINNRVLKGALIINYTGHGGEVGWAHERVLEVADIDSWTNIDNLPAFVTATCEFSRYDDPGRTSAGELVLLNPNGGGVSLFTTTRLVFSFANSTLNRNFYKHLFPVAGQPIPTMGEVMRKTVNEGSSGVIGNSRNFSLLGDPAQRLAYPVDSVVTTSVNGNPAGGVPDTLKALGLVTITGEIRDRNGVKMTSFNGLVYPTVFDKAATINTLANDPESHIRSFKLQKNILYKGKASVTNGDFSFTFIVPKDISYNYGVGRISYYAFDGVTDAHGNYENVIIGGSANNVTADANGPTVNLYMNDDKFVPGGITNEDPLLYAVVSDPSGINTVGNGIGHDIAAVLDDNTNKSIILNEYYQADLNSYQSGVVRYPFSKLSEGRHTLKIKVWDVFNNSTDAYTDFIVSKSSKLALSHVLNYPNPFTTNTEFMFEHNQPCTDLDVNIQVFTVSGKVVKSISEHVSCDGFRAAGITWNGRDDYDQKIGKGVYVYRVKVRTPEGSVADAFEKLVILN